MNSYTFYALFVRKPHDDPDTIRVYETYGGKWYSRADVEVAAASYRNKHGWETFIQPVHINNPKFRKPRQNNVA